MKRIVSWVFIALVSISAGCGVKAKSSWIPIYVQQEWYLQKERAEKSFVGIVYDEGEGRWPRLKGQYYDRYFLDTAVTSYHIYLRKWIELDFQEFVGQKVEIIGKKDVIKRNQVEIRIIIPAKIRFVE